MEKKIREIQNAGRFFGWEGGDGGRESDSAIMPADAAFALAAGFLAGVLVANLGWNLALVAPSAIFVTAASAIAITWLAFQAVFRAIRLSALCLAAFFLGFGYYHLYFAWQASATKLPTGKSAEFSAIVTDEPSASAKYLFFTVDLEKPYAGAMTIFAPLGRDVRYGDEMQITGAVESSGPPEMPGDTPAVFPKKLKFIATHRGFWLREKLLDFKAAILAKFDEALPGAGGIGVAGDEAALLGGETLGGMDGMSAALKNEMSASGTSYITAMYGYKIFVIVAAIEAVLAGFVGRRTRFAAALAAVALFVLMAGGGASVVRGAIMGVLALIAKNTGRVFNMRNALAFTALAMALADPTILTQAVFLLSFLSVIGIVYLIRPLEKLFGWDGREGAGASRGIAAAFGGMLDWREAIVVATASLVPIIPVIAVAFGDFSLSSFPSNALIALPLPAVTFFGFVLALVGFAPRAVAGWLTFLVAQFARVVLLYQLAVIKIFAVIVVPLPTAIETPVMIIAYYAALTWFAYAYQ